MKYMGETMVENKLVSVIITTYKRPAKILARAIESVLAQTYENLELLVVNDYPEDEILVKEIEILIEGYNDNRIKYIVHSSNQGACKARNTGIIHSKGEYIACLDDDDTWETTKLENQLKGFKSDKVGMVYSPFYNVYEDNSKKLMVRGTKSGNLFEDMLWTNCVGGTSMTMIRREVFDVCGMFDERLLSSQDYDMWLRIAKDYDIVCVNKPLIYRYVMQESITGNFEKQKKGFNLFTEKHSKYYIGNPDALNYRLNRRANKWIEQGHCKDGFKLWKKAIKVKFFSRYNIMEPCKGIIKFILKKHK